MTGARGLRRLAAASAILLLATTLQTALPFAAHLASASTVTPVLVEGNPTCADFDAEGTMLKIEGSAELVPADSGTYSSGELSVTVDIRATEMGSVFDWTANQPIDVVVAKGGPMANVYVYGGVTADTGLHAPFNTTSEGYYGLSHISFCTGDATTTTTEDTTTTTEDTTTTTEGTTTTTEGTTTTAARRTTTTTAAPLGAIGDYVWLDLDKDGAQGPPDVEKPVLGATVQLLASDGTLLADQVTGLDGRYLFDDLPAGNYRVQVVFRGATYTVARAPGVSNAANSDVEPLGNGIGRTALIHLDDGEVDLTWDAGVIVEVLGVQIESTTTAPPVDPVTVVTLPFTGSSDAPILVPASIVALIGAMALLLMGRPSPRKRVAASAERWTNR